MNTIIHAPITASLMLTGSAILAAIALKVVRIKTPRLRQFLLLAVLLQGMMLFRVPVKLPWLHQGPADVVMADDPMVNVFNEVHYGGVPTDESGKRDDALPPFILPNAHGSPDLVDRGPTRHVKDDLSQALAFSSIFGSGNVKSLIYSVALVWLVGFAFVVLRSCFLYVRLCRLVGRLPTAPSAWNAEWKDLCKRKNQQTPTMLVSETAGPMLVRRLDGYALVVPTGFWEQLSASQRRGVLLHELAHLCRRDVWRQVFIRAIASLHWWNPAAWWSVKRYEESTEWACDEFLTKNDPVAARGLATSLVRLLEFSESTALNSIPAVRGIGVQSMAAPPLTERVKRLLQPAPSGDSTMKRLLFGSLAAGLLTISAVQFQLVAAPPEKTSLNDNGNQGDDLAVLSPTVTKQLSTLQQRLDHGDEATRLLAELLASDPGQIAFAGALDQLTDRHRDEAKADAIPRFVAKHFRADANGKLTILPEYSDLPQQWIARSEKLGDALGRLSEKMSSIADRIQSSDEADLMAKRMLTHEYAALVITLEEFDGQVDPTDRVLAEAFEDLLVKRGDQMIVVPTLGRDERKKIERFERATEIFQRLEQELKDYGEEFATPDERHERLVAAMATTPFVALIAIDVSEDDHPSAASAVEEVFEHLEHASRDTPGGLVIREERAWEHLEQVLERAERATDRLVDAEISLRKVAVTLDPEDPMTKRLAKQLEHGVLKYHLAAEVPYAELDLAEQIEEMLSNVMEPVENNGLKVREDVADHVMERASELLSGCRRIRRYIRQIDTFVEKVDDPQFSSRLGPSGRLVLLSDIRDAVERESVDAMSLLEKELFQKSDDGPDAKLTIRPDRTHVVRDLAKRVEELKAEMASDDF